LWEDHDAGNDKSCEKFSSIPTAERETTVGKWLVEQIAHWGTQRPGEELLRDRLVFADRIVHRKRITKERAPVAMSVRVSAKTTVEL